MDDGTKQAYEWNIRRSNFIAHLKKLPPSDRMVMVTQLRSKIKALLEKWINIFDEANKDKRITSNDHAEKTLIATKKGEDGKSKIECGNGLLSTNRNNAVHHYKDTCFIYVDKKMCMDNIYEIRESLQKLWVHLDVLAETRGLNGTPEFVTEAIIGTEIAVGNQNYLDGQKLTQEEEQRYGQARIPTLNDVIVILQSVPTFRSDALDKGREMMCWDLPTIDYPPNEPWYIETPSKPIKHAITYAHPFVVYILDKLNVIDYWVLAPQ